MASIPVSRRLEAVDRRRQMIKQRSSPTFNSCETEETPVRPPSTNENFRPTSAPRATPLFTSPSSTNLLSPRNRDNSIPSSKFRQEILKSCSKASNIEQSPLPACKSPTASLRRRERLARHSHLLGNRGKTSAMTPQQPNKEPAFTLEEKRAISVMDRRTPKERTSSEEIFSTQTPLPPRTPIFSPSMTVAGAKSGNASMESEIAKRARDRRARGAHKLFILATSPSMDESAAKVNMTPLEIHLSAHNEPKSSCSFDSPSVMSCSSITTATSTLSKYSRERKNDLRQRKNSARRLYAHATATGSSFDEKNTNFYSTVDPSPSGAKSDGKSVSSKDNGAAPVRSKSIRRNVSPDSESVTSASSKRSAAVQRARKALARAKPQLDNSIPKPSIQSTPPLILAREKVLAQAQKLSPSPQTRRNLDKRTARLKYGQAFACDIAQYQATRSRPIHDIGENLHRRGARNGVSVFIRKRPIFDFEVERGDFDVVFTEGRDDCDTVVVHSCNMHADMQKMLVKPTAFPCSAAFDETCTNDILYMNVGKPMVKLAANGGLATILTYGQTGSGKTHTITGIEERVAQDLFRMISLSSQQVTIQFIELEGKQCNDLLGEGNVKIVEHEGGSVEVLNALSMEVRSPNELYEMILLGKRKRSTEATDKNGASSRSHAVCQITIAHKKNMKLRGVLTLIDCAGSEWRHDSLYHSRERQKESTEINSSLWALKECIRARAGEKQQKGVIPYRSSNLTRILRESLERKDAQLCVIATVAPNATDTEHTMETLKTVSNLVAMDNAIEEMEAHEVALISPKNDPDILAPKQWDRGRLVEWMERKRLLEKDVPDHMDGKQIMRMSRIQLKNVFFENDNGEKADRLFIFLRAETDKATRAQLERRIALFKTRGHV